MSGSERAGSTATVRTATLEEITSLLAACIAVPTHQFCREHGAGDERALCELLRPHLERLTPDELVICDALRGDGTPGAYLFARWGTPKLLWNAHLDTVPPNAGWQTAPWQPRLTSDAVVGLGACDTKAAIAVLVVAFAELRRTGHLTDVALLFSGDEEAHAAIVPRFLATPQAAAVEQVIVCEPTSRRAGTSHRGIIAYTTHATGPGGHSSRADSTAAPILALCQLGNELERLATRAELTVDAAEPGLCFNLGTMHGGVAANVIPQRAELQWSIRPAAGFARALWERGIAELLTANGPRATVANSLVLDQAPFACHELAWASRVVGPWVEGLGPVQFWTEAALWSEAGKTAVVVGPGDIAHAHAPDEIVRFDELRWFHRLVLGVMNHRA